MYPGSSHKLIDLLSKKNVALPLNTPLEIEDDITTNLRGLMKIVAPAEKRNCPNNDYNHNCSGNFQFLVHQPPQHASGKNATIAVVHANDTILMCGSSGEFAIWDRMDHMIQDHVNILLIHHIRTCVSCKINVARRGNVQEHDAIRGSDRGILRA